MLGLRGERIEQSPEQEMQPVRIERGGLSMEVMSIGFLLGKETDAVVLRGPRKDAVIRQFITGVSWGALDVLIIDTPPGTSDEHLTLLSMLSKHLTAGEDGAIVVSTPQAVSLVDVSKELTFCKTNGMPILGVVENMCHKHPMHAPSAPLAPSSLPLTSHPLTHPLLPRTGCVGRTMLRTPLASLQFLDAAGADVTARSLQRLSESCPEILDQSVGLEIFPVADGGAEAMARAFEVPFLGRVPMDIALTAAADEGYPRVAAFAPLADRLFVQQNV
jgi:Mrp family chromosome partitioning ATPase